MISPILLVVAALAAARITRLVTRDTLTQQLRIRAINRLGPTSLAAYLVQCDWCAGVWVSAGVVPAVWFGHSHLFVIVPATWLAVAEIVGLIASRDGD